MSNKTVKITYQSNYNGCSIGDDDEKYATLSEHICEHALQYYNEDGEFEGDINDVESLALQLAKDLHPNEEFEFEEDGVSS